VGVLGHAIHPARTFRLSAVRRYLISQAGDYLNTALVFSGIIAIAIVGLILGVCLRGLLLLADPSRRR
jgi:hypothetical protein